MIEVDIITLHGRSVGIVAPYGRSVSIVAPYGRSGAWQVAG